MNSQINFTYVMMNINLLEVITAPYIYQNIQESPCELYQEITHLGLCNGM